jgi:hypothetical protein
MTRPLLQLSAPDPNSPTLSARERTRTRRREPDPGILLGEKGIPVKPSEDRARLNPPTEEDDKPWTQTVFRTMSGGIKSDYLKCMYTVEEWE